MIPDMPDFSVLPAAAPDRGVNRERGDDLPLPKAKTERFYRARNRRRNADL